MNRVTLKQLGEQLNLSAMTVSRALRGHPDISDATRQLVLEAARSQRYVPNEQARSMVTGKTFTIGVLVPSLTNHFYTKFFTCLDDACFQSGYSTLIASSEFNSQRERRNLNVLLSKRVDALVVGLDYPNANTAVLEQFTAQGVPIVHLGSANPPYVPYPSVGFDEDRVAALAAEHLHRLGHRRVMYLSAAATQDRSLPIHLARREKFALAWRALARRATLEEFHTGDAMHGGVELAEALSKRSAADRPTAIACSTDRLAMSFLSAVQVHRTRGLKQVSVIGCDDIDGAAECAVPLTTVKLPTQALAEGVWGLLQKRLNAPKGPVPSSIPEHVAIEPELIVRHSTRAVE